MKKNQPKTKVPNDYADEFLTKTIPFFASNPGWRNLFKTFARLSESERAGILVVLENGEIPSGLVPGKQLSTATEFLRLNLESLVGPRMMVKMIDYHHLRVEKQSLEKGVVIHV
jgi:hypothetical protein